jgi:hypothetical protein
MEFPLEIKQISFLSPTSIWVVSYHIKILSFIICPLFSSTKFTIIIRDMSKIMAQQLVDYHFVNL